MKVKTLEQVLIGIIKECEIEADTFMLAVHNTCCFGGPFKGSNWGADDEVLKDLFKGIDIAVSAARKSVE